MNTAWAHLLAPVRALWAEDALLPGGWARNVLLRWDATGHITQVDTDMPAPPGVARAAGPMLPGMPNLHSHAFQRGFAGLTEFRGQAPHSFWSWRQQMYAFAHRITPESLEAIAVWLYLEMLEAGYTSVCEFHYLHHGAGGQPYADDTTLGLALLRAARRVGIGMTLLPVLYQTSGFGMPPTRAQSCFICSTDQLLNLLRRLAPAARAQGAALGLAPHSLRAVPPDALRASVAGLHAMLAQAPVHIHIAEQTREVQDCVAWSGQTPVQWLLDHAPVDARWCLVHATHMTPAECAAAAGSGAVAGLCPSTEANLGDGIFDLPQWLEHGGRWGLGSDSQICVNVAEELMLLEYGQRLQRRERNVLASSAQPQVATAMMLQAVAGGAQAAGRAIAGLAPGQQADFVVLDARHVALCGLTADSALAGHVFASHRTSAVHAVWVAGQQRVLPRGHPLRASAQAAFVRARRQLLQA
ncbi:formimidoylglutamate deiminase [Acidovorax sp. CCYZU-2555]|uniref:formimidoylglutamate deiminase n=1 Tax=Acidovorax sp. CCYZU-2555 TaxID=2835042 RepID=UPI001BD09541|nr:formimidoylglutamate deiminase [Acidovorax sp. CCYZU-2555]MBS7780862.1 formimidoylglutamate deiminase [Acidovorax sp. CCYZU-2555]